MPLQNRVDPRGSLIVADARGAWLGNRGKLHNEHKEIIARWQHKRWVVCQLTYNGRKRQVFSPNNYSELFFLDEATAFSAGHRPCGECRRERYLEFKEAWRRTNGAGLPEIAIAQIDEQLHMERVVPGGEKASHPMEFRDLPFGAFIERDNEAYLYWQMKLRKWSPSGYVEVGALPEPGEVVKVLTPFSIVQMYKNGFTPQVHESASG